MDIFNSGVSQMFAMAGSNEALRYVSYPTQVRGGGGGGGGDGPRASPSRPRRRGGT